LGSGACGGGACTQPGALRQLQTHTLPPRHHPRPQPPPSQLTAIGIVGYQMAAHPYPSPQRALVVRPDGWRALPGGGVGLDDQLVAGFNIIFGAWACGGAA
jgi:hypothetical protein